MSKILSLILVLALLLSTVAVLSSCDALSSLLGGTEGGSEDTTPKKLDTPVLTLNDNVASWEKIDGAVSYEVNLGIEIKSIPASRDTYALEWGQSIQIRAVGDGKKTLTGAWSNRVQYGESPVITPPTEEPDNTPNEKLTVSAIYFENGKVHWIKNDFAIGYQISIGMTVYEFDADTLFTSVSTGDKVMIRVIGDEINYASSSWSDVFVYPGYDVPIEDMFKTEINYKPDTPDNPGDPDTPDNPDTPDDGEDEEIICAHIDADNNGKCDSCLISVIVVVDFYSINDLHGKFCDSDGQPGVDELSTYLKSREEYDDNVVIFSAGDMWQGTAESGLTYGSIMTEWMNIIGCVSMTLGNHEYDWGEEYIKSNLEIAEFPFLAINIYDKSTGKLADYCTPSIMIEKGGIEIGIIGAMGDCYSSILSEMVAGVEFKVGSELTRLIKAESERLRALGADMIVLSSHDGYDAYDHSLSNGYVDLVFEGHTHSAYSKTDAYGVNHLQGGGENNGITHAEVEINSATGKIRVRTAEVLRSNIYSSLTDDLETEELEKKYDDIIKKAYAELGSNNRYLSDNEIEDIVAKLYYEAGKEIWGDEYNIALGGGFLRTRDPYDLYAGNITYSDLYSVLPFNNRLVLCSISGRDLLNRFINASSNDYHVYTELSSSDISQNATYYVVVDTYTSSYRYNNLTEVKRYEEDIYARDLFAEYVKEGNLAGSSTPDVPITPVDPDDYNLTSILDAISIASKLSAGATANGYYYVMGRIDSIASGSSGAKYGNMFLTDGNGNTIYMYGLKDENGNLYQSMSPQPGVGDIILVKAQIQNYDNFGEPLYELKNAVLVGFVEDN